MRRAAATKINDAGSLNPEEEEKKNWTKNREGKGSLNFVRDLVHVTPRAARSAAYTLIGAIDANGPAVDFSTIHILQGGISRVGLCKGDEPETTRFSGKPVEYNLGVKDFSVSRESVTEGFIGS